MSNFFYLTLDTTGPQSPSVSINAGAAYATAQLVTLTIGTSDSDTTGYQMKIWGDVDTAYDTDIQATEAASSWISYSPSRQVKLSSANGTKTIYLKIRDSVLNESSQASDAISLDTVLPIASISAGPDVTKISKVSTKDTCTFSFTVDSHVQAWKVKVVPSTSSLQDAGTQLGTTNGSTNVTGGALAASTPQAVAIKGADLEVASAGDGTKIIKVFVQDDAGNWSV